MGFSFGSFDAICQTAALIPCAMLGGENGIEPTCYARNVEINDTILFQPATLLVHIAALIMTAIMVMHIRSKYTAVGRKEMVFFFYLYALLELLGIFLDTAIIPFSSNVYPWFAAVHTGVMCAVCWSLMLNGFVGFQFAEDGTPLSLWTLRLTSLVVFLVTGFISVATFKNIAGLSNTKPIALWIVYYIFNAACIMLYIISQLILVIRTLDDRWPIGDIIFGVAFFAIGQVLIYGFSVKICDAIKHYLDGLFFGSLCSLLAVMMVYKYYDTITKEDLEFSVGSKQAVWEVKESLLGNGAGGGFGLDDGTDSMMPPYSQQYGGQGYSKDQLPPMPSYASQASSYGMQGYPPQKGTY